MLPRILVANSRFLLRCLSNRRFIRELYSVSGRTEIQCYIFSDNTAVSNQFLTICGSNSFLPLYLWQWRQKLKPLPQRLQGIRHTFRCKGVSALETLAARESLKECLAFYPLWTREVGGLENCWMVLNEPLCNIPDQGYVHRDDG